MSRSTALRMKTKRKKKLTPDKAAKWCNRKILVWLRYESNKIRNQRDKHSSPHFHSHAKNEFSFFCEYCWEMSTSANANSIPTQAHRVQVQTGKENSEKGQSEQHTLQSFAKSSIIFNRISSCLQFILSPSCSFSCSPFYCFFPFSFRSCHFFCAVRWTYYSPWFTKSHRSRDVFLFLYFGFIS